MSEKIMRFFLWGLTICLGGYLMARGILYLREDSSESAHEMLGTLCECIEECAFETYLPQYAVGEISSQTVVEENFFWNWSALVQYLQRNTQMETAAENEKITNEIVKLHNKILLDEILLENQKKAQSGQEQNSSVLTENE